MRSIDLRVRCFTSLFSVFFFFLPPPATLCVALRAGIPLSICTNKASLISLRAFKYFFTAFFASSEIKTTRILPPLPRMDNSSEVKSISEFNEQSSDTRSPVENKSSSMALSRKSFNSLPLGEFSNLFNSKLVIKSSCLSPTFANSIRSGGRALISFLARYFKNTRSAII